MGPGQTPDESRRSSFVVPSREQFVKDYKSMIWGVLMRGGIRQQEMEDAYQDIVAYMWSPSPSDGLNVFERYNPGRGVPFHTYISGMIKVRILNSHKVDYGNLIEFAQLPDLSEEDGEQVDVEDLQSDDPLENIFNAELTKVLLDTLRVLETFPKTRTCDYALLFKMALMQYGKTGGPDINATALAGPYGMATEAHRPFSREAVNQQWAKLKQTPIMQRLYRTIRGRIQDS